MIGGKDKELTDVKPAKSRTNFGNKNNWLAKVNPAERKVYEFAAANRADVDVFFNCKTTAFFRQWIKDSLDYYKDLLAVDAKIDGASLRGMIQGQKEIQAMIDMVEKAHNKKQEAK